MPQRLTVAGWRRGTGSLSLRWLCVATAPGNHQLLLDMTFESLPDLVPVHPDSHISTRRSSYGKLLSFNSVSQKGHGSGSLDTIISKPGKAQTATLEKSSTFCKTPSGIPTCHGPAPSCMLAPPCSQRTRVASMLRIFPKQAR